mmetsp:Transcript_17089/g.20877  ORF Transcript_17089/g.20877 Transcript_17089/m.20877 type:complete len:130 (+) Transcript_17089:509-898(+)
MRPVYPASIMSLSVLLEPNPSKKISSLSTNLFVSFLSMPLSTNHISRHHRICQLLMPPPDLLLYNACLHFLAIIVHWLLIYCDPTTSFFQTRHSDSSCYSFITNSITPKLQNTCYIDHFDYFNRARSHV